MTVIKLSKEGKDALNATDPNDFIFHSDYNTFKIIKEGVLTAQSVTADPTTFSVAHNQTNVPAFYAFAKFADGYVALPNQKERADAAPVERYWLCEADSTNLYFTFYKGASANYSVSIKYYVFESPLTGTATVVPPTFIPQKIQISKENNHVRAVYDPNQIIYSSDYDTLKYHRSGVQDVTVAGATVEVTLAHGLGYTPFYTAYVNYFVAASATNFSMCPATFVSGPFYTFASCYADATNLYFRVETNSAAVTYNFYYKIFRNDLGL